MINSIHIKFTLTYILIKNCTIKIQLTQLIQLMPIILNI